MSVDQIGRPDSIFEKIRIFLRYLPRELLPVGFSFKEHVSLMKIINPENGNTIVGEAGEDIGRGGRSLITFKDESGHYEHPELIEASLLANALVQMDISSVPVHSTGTVFSVVVRAALNGIPNRSSILRRFRFSSWIGGTIPPRRSSGMMTYAIVWSVRACSTFSPPRSTAITLPPSRGP